jgi:hypothetical protein
VHRWALELALHYEIERYERLLASALEEGACARWRGLAQCAYTRWRWGTFAALAVMSP